MGSIGKGTRRYSAHVSRPRAALSSGCSDKDAALVTEPAVVAILVREDGPEARRGGVSYA